MSFILKRKRGKRRETHPLNHRFFFSLKTAAFLTIVKKLPYLISLLDEFNSTVHQRRWAAGSKPKQEPRPRISSFTLMSNRRRKRESKDLHRLHNLPRQSLSDFSSFLLYLLLLAAPAHPQLHLIALPSSSSSTSSSPFIVPELTLAKTAVWHPLWLQVTRFRRSRVRHLKESERNLRVGRSFTAAVEPFVQYLHLFRCLRSFIRFSSKDLNRICTLIKTLSLKIWDWYLRRNKL